LNWPGGQTTTKQLYLGFKLILTITIYRLKLPNPFNYRLLHPPNSHPRIMVISVYLIGLILAGFGGGGGMPDLAAGRFEKLVASLRLV
jgi:hypothetical protein